jgi:hypothetical protein
VQLIIEPMHAGVKQTICRLFFGCGWLNNGTFLQKVQRFLVLNLAAKARHSGIFCKYFPDTLTRIVHFSSDSVDLGFDVVVVDVDLLLVRNVAEQQ